MNDLPDASLRVLNHLADQLRTGFNGRIEIDVKSGNIANYREIRSIRPSEMPPTQPQEYLRIITRAK